VPRAYFGSGNAITRTAFAPRTQFAVYGFEAQTIAESAEKVKNFPRTLDQNEMCTRRFCDSRTPSAVGTIGSLSPRPEMVIVSAPSPSAISAFLTDFARLSDSALLRDRSRAIGVPNDADRG